MLGEACASAACARRAARAGALRRSVEPREARGRLGGGSASSKCIDDVRPRAGSDPDFSEGHPRGGLLFSAEPVACRRGLGSAAACAVRRRDARAARTTASRATLAHPGGERWNQGAGIGPHYDVDAAASRRWRAAASMSQSGRRARQRQARRRGAAARAAPDRRRGRSPRRRRRPRVDRLARGFRSSPHQALGDYVTDESRYSRAARSSTRSPNRSRGCATGSQGSSGSSGLTKAGRLARILWVGLRFGLHEFVPQAAGSFLVRALAGRTHEPRGQRLREALETLGPIYVKFGQVLRGAICFRWTSPTSWQSCRTRCPRFLPARGGRSGALARQHRRRTLCRIRRESGGERLDRAGPPRAAS